LQAMEKLGKENKMCEPPIFLVLALRVVDNTL
jgi:hypothetical protein